MVSSHQSSDWSLWVSEALHNVLYYCNKDFPIMSYPNGRTGNKHLQGKANDFLAFICFVIMVKTTLNHLLYIL